MHQHPRAHKKRSTTYFTAQQAFIVHRDRAKIMNGGSQCSCGRTGHRLKRGPGEMEPQNENSQLVAFDVFSNTIRVLVPPIRISSTCMPFRRTAVR